MRIISIVVMLFASVFAQSAKPFDLESCLEKGHRTVEDCQCSQECSVALSSCIDDASNITESTKRACNHESGACTYQCLRRNNALWKGELGAIDKMLAESIFSEVNFNKVPSRKDVPMCSTELTDVQAKYSAGTSFGCIATGTKSGCDEKGVDLIISMLTFRACVARHHPESGFR